MDREATAAITGYMYQFDATILGILELASSEELLVEGVEDFDAMGVDSTKHYQCKYYASQQLTSAVIREAVLPMLKGFLALDKDTRKVRRYFLYGYFKDTTQGDKTISAEAMGGILGPVDKPVLAPRWLGGVTPTWPRGVTR